MADSTDCGDTLGTCVAGVCENCGELGEECCDGSCMTGAACVSDTCVTCGALDQVCCADRACDNGLSCEGSDLGTCQECGDLDEPCCGGESPCDQGLSCVATAGGAQCQTCGGAGQPCCEDRICGEGVCVGGTNTAYCHTDCGDVGQACCSGAGAQCAQGLHCQGGECAE